jgi:hypothetical protein
MRSGRGRSAYLMKDATVDLGDYFSFVAVAVAIFALFYSGSQAHAAKDSAEAARDSAIAAEEQARAVEEQTQLQRDLARAAAEPMLWVDIRDDDATGRALVLLLGNAGTSLARNVKVTFDPAPPSTKDIKEVLEILERGIAAVAPGRTLEWVLGAAHNTVDWNARNEYKVRIEGEGPFGPLEPVEFVIIISDLKGLHGAAGGSLRTVALQIQEIAKATNQLNGSIKKLQPAERPISPMEPEAIKPSIESSIPMEPLSGDDS